MPPYKAIFKYFYIIALKLFKQLQAFCNYGIINLQYVKILWFFGNNQNNHFIK